jgi:periplasmic divalent cation tolerance protein
MPANFIYVTTASARQAREIGRRLVAERLAACVNILDRMTSFYWWDGTIEEGHEAVLIAKTRADLVKRVVARIKELHSYSCPCVVALRVSGGNPEFLRWIAAETKPRKAPRAKRAANGKRKSKSRR